MARKLSKQKIYRAWRRVLRSVGSRADLPKHQVRAYIAHQVGVTPPCVYQWETRPVPAHRCRAIEKLTGGDVTRFELRPDIFGTGP